MKQLVLGEEILYERLIGRDKCADAVRASMPVSPSMCKSLSGVKEICWLTRPEIRVGKKKNLINQKVKEV